MGDHGGARPRAGRLREDPKGELRDRRLTILMTLSEFEALERLAKRHRVTPGAAARMLVTAGLQLTGRRRR